ncbi:hypothetical protein GCM10010313_15140 [Streptomyces violarus]|nr:hypothetical protein GCM10010313_15140 [Streptomyces violarus]
MVGRGGAAGGGTWGVPAMGAAVAGGSVGPSGAGEVAPAVGGRSGTCPDRPGGFVAVGKVTGSVGRADGGSQGARRGVSVTSAAPARGAGSTGSEAGRSSTGSPTAPAAEAKRSSRESGAGVGPVSSVESSYKCLHQSSS